MSKLADAIAELEANYIALQAERDGIERQLHRYEGAHKENRRELARAQATIKEQREMLATFRAHFHTFHGSAERVAQEERTLKSVEAPEPQVVPLSRRIARLVTGNEEAAA